MPMSPVDFGNQKNFIFSIKMPVADPEISKPGEGVPAR